MLKLTLSNLHLLSEQRLKKHITCVQFIVIEVLQILKDPNKSLMIIDWQEKTGEANLICLVKFFLNEYGCVMYLYMIAMLLTCMCQSRYPVHCAVRQWNVKFYQSTKVKTAHRGLSPVSSVSFHCLQLI